MLDAWGEPLYLQWQQEWRDGFSPFEPTGGLPPGRPLTDGLWDPVVDQDPSTVQARVATFQPGRTFVGLSMEHSTYNVPSLFNITNFAVSNYSKPVLPTEIRPFLTSERLREFDGVPNDYQDGPNYTLVDPAGP